MLQVIPRDPNIVSVLMCSDTMFLIASNPPDGLKRHSQLLLLISPVVEGMLGGLSTVVGATNAWVLLSPLVALYPRIYLPLRYISDCTSHGSR